MLVSDRRVSPSKDEAVKVAIAQVLPLERCSQCHAPVASAQLRSVEEIKPAKYTVWGYICECGEKVEVFRIEDEVSTNPPPTFTTACSKGHSRTMTSAQAIMLPSWREEPN